LDIVDLSLDLRFSSHCVAELRSSPLTNSEADEADEADRAFLCQGRLSEELSYKATPYVHLVVYFEV
jgi:hypothetical protein